MGETKVEHLIVLMMENRSFDHLLGYLEYPTETGFEGIRGKEADFANPLADGSTAVPNNQAGYFINPGPEHGHENVMRQLMQDRPRSFPYPLTNKGFAADYHESFNAPGQAAMECFAPEQLPVLSTLAREFAVCDHWFCSVPGATWPNRNFAHAGTSDGEVNIQERPYFNPTVFQQLSDANRDWAIYYGGFPAQCIALVNTWNQEGENWSQRFKPMKNLYRAIQYDRLPRYAFVEPDMLGETTNSQHPSMGGEVNFKAGEQLICSLYRALRDNMPVFEKTLFLITYDEHGGFFDHVAPPQGAEWSVREAYHDPSGYIFPFDLLGARVPAVLVSPWIGRGTVDHNIYDHTSIPATARKLAGVDALPLTPRDARANTFDRVLNLDQPRPVEDLPDIPIPFVDENLRQPLGQVELRESLLYILTRLIWTQIAAQPKQYMRRAASRSRVPRTDPDRLPELAHQVIMRDVLPNLSPRAQAVLAQFSPIQGLESISDEITRWLPIHPDAIHLQLTLAGIQNIIQGLLNFHLVDEAMRFAELVWRRIFEAQHILLHTPGVIRSPTLAPRLSKRAWRISPGAPIRKPSSGWPITSTAG